MKAKINKNNFSVLKNKLVIVPIELAGKGLAKVVIMEKRRPFIYQNELLKAQEEAKKNKLGIWQ